LYFPRVDVPASTTQPRDLTILPGGSETILVIEDEAQLRLLARVLLQQRGYTVFDADGAERALEIARDRSPPIDLVLTDVVMPGLSGPQVAERLVARHPELKVIYMSGFTDDMVVRHGVIAAGLNFLQKPFT